MRKCGGHLTRGETRPACFTSAATANRACTRGWKRRLDGQFRRAGKQDQSDLFGNRRQAVPVQGRVCRSAVQLRRTGKPGQRLVLGSNGKPCLHKDGYAGVRWTYDSLGNKIDESFRGLDGKPCLHKDGYSETKIRYDDRGNQTRWNYFGLDGKPCLHKDAYAEAGSMTMSGETARARPTLEPMANPCWAKADMPK